LPGHPRVVIVGAGFAGLEAAKALAGTSTEVTLGSNESREQWCRMKKTKN
jgi:NADH dehydrogenase FAD-containing subunit